MRQVLDNSAHDTLRNPTRNEAIPSHTGATQLPAPCQGIASRVTPSPTFFAPGRRSLIAPPPAARPAQWLRRRAPVVAMASGSFPCALHPGVYRSTARSPCQGASAVKGVRHLVSPLPRRLSVASPPRWCAAAGRPSTPPKSVGEWDRPRGSPTAPPIIGRPRSGRAGALPMQCPRPQPCSRAPTPHCRCRRCLRRRRWQRPQPNLYLGQVADGHPHRGGGRRPTPRPVERLRAPTLVPGWVAAAQPSRSVIIFMPGGIRCTPRLPRSMSASAPHSKSKNTCVHHIFSARPPML